MEVYKRGRSPERGYRAQSGPTAKFSNDEEHALGVLLDYMGHEVLARSEAEPEKSHDEIVKESRKETLAWLTANHPAAGLAAEA